MQSSEHTLLQTTTVHSTSGLVRTSVRVRVRAVGTRVVGEQVEEAGGGGDARRRAQQLHDSASARIHTHVRRRTY